MPRYILDQTRRNGDDLAALRTRVDRIEGKLDALSGRMDRLEREVQGVRRDLDSFKRDLDGFKRGLPALIAETMREVLREERGR